MSDILEKLPMTYCDDCDIEKSLCSNEMQYCEADIIKSYDLGRADYQAECEKIFEDSPPMHFNREQIMWVKERIKIQYQQGKADAIEEAKKNIEHMMYETAFNCMEDKTPTTYSDVLIDCIKRLDGWFEYVKKQLKEQSNER